MDMLHSNQLTILLVGVIEQRLIAIVRAINAISETLWQSGAALQDKGSIGKAWRISFEDNEI